MPSSPALAAAPEALRAAEAAQLGQLVEVFPYQARRHLFGAVVLTVLVVVIGVVVVRSLRGGDTPDVWVILVVGAGAIYGAWYALSAFREAVANRRRNREVCLFEGGLVIVDTGQAEVWSWRDIDSVRQHTTQYRSEYGGDRGRYMHWTVVRRDGRDITFDNVDISAADRLGATIARMTA